MFAPTVDLTDPRIREGLRILADVARSMHERLQTDHIDFAVAILNDKSVIYAPVLDVRDTVERRIAAYADLGRAAAGQIDSALHDAGIPVINTGPALQARLAAGAALFREGDDPHMNGLGYRAVAETLRTYVAGLAPAKR